MPSDEPPFDCVRLAIADPPYLGRGARHYGVGAARRESFSGPAGTSRRWAHHTTEHKDAAMWDDPATHRALLDRLDAEYDGWAVALWPDSLHVYAAHVPTAHVAAWFNTTAVPGGARILTSWEPVIVRPPASRRRRRGPGSMVRDVLVAPSGGGERRHVGGKPRAWTAWVLDMLGYCPTHDTVDDLFHGSGAVTAALAQGRLVECRCAA